MKRILFFVSLLILSGTLKSQTTLISEGFETLPYKFTSSLTGGVPHWKATSNYHYSGLKADSCAVISGANTMFLLSDTFNTDGKQFVLLEFVHIAKIDYMDRAEIEISINGGNWTKLTNTMYLGGSSVFGIYNDRFDSRSYSEWDFTNNSLLPASNWWKKEVFDISSVAKDTNNVALRFRLTDGGTLGSSGAYGWLIDDVKISVAVVENIPPSISLNSPILQDSVFSTGPFNINATITDASGIASAKVFYKLGLGNWDSIAMTHVGSLYNAPIPSYPYGTNITYYVWAKDAVGNTNTTVQKSFLIKQPDVEVSVIDIYTGNTYFPTSSNYGYKRDGQLLFQSEINKFGLIKALQWRVATVSSVDLPIKIYLKSINATSLLTDNWNNIISSATLVFDGTVNFPDTGWRKIIFQNQFNYTSDNLLILTETNLGGTGLAPYANFYYNISGSNNHLYYYDDNNPPNSINLYLNANRSNIKLGFTPSNYNIDAGISQITSPTSMVLANLAMDIKVILRNFGTTPLNSVKIRYAIDGGIASSPIAWNGNLLQDIYLPQFAIDNPSFQPGQHTLKVWTELPNNLSDMNNLNDTATISFYACSSLFNGSYTIGGVGADYPDFSSAVNALNNCGIMGPTIFNVNAGTYNERIILPPISGSSPTNTITFQSANGDNTSVVLTDSSTSTADNYIIKFVGADYVTIKKITIYNKGISYAKNIDISGGSSNNRIIDNIFLAPVTNNASTNIAHIYSINGTTSIDSNNWIMNNQFINGSVGIYWGGGNASNLESGTRIINNVFTDMYYQGMYLIYQNAPEVTGNTINTTTLYSGFYGLYSYNCQNKLKILQNKISISSPNGGIGIYLQSCYATLGQEGLIANNFVSISGGSGNSATGLSIGYSSYHNIFYNSFNITCTNPSLSRSVLVNNGISSINIRNNNIVNNGGGYAFYVSPGTGLLANYNNLFTTGSKIGFWGSDRTDLATWKAVTGLDTNSISVNPSYPSFDNLHVFINAVDAKGIPVSDVTNDIDGNTRNPVTPDIGADEYTPVPWDASLVQIVAPQSGCSLTATEYPIIKVKNQSFLTIPIDSLRLFYKLDNGTWVMNKNTSAIPPDSFYTHYFTVPANFSAVGNHNFSTFLSMNLDGYALNDSLMNTTIFNGYNLYSAPYTMGFEVYDDNASWTKLDVNGDGKTWTFPYNYLYYAHSGTNSAQYYGSNSNTANDWLFSRCFTLTAGENYKVEFWYRGTSTNYPQSLDLKMGNSNTPSAMSTTLTTLANFNNTFYMKSSVTFSPAASGTYYFGWFIHSAPSYYSTNIDDINISIVPNLDAGVSAITTPSTGCGLTQDSVRIKIKNYGSLAINGNLVAHYKVLGTLINVSQPVTSTIAAGDSIIFTFNSPLNLGVTTNDSVFNIMSWTSLTGDPVFGNDSCMKMVLSSHVPTSPVTTGSSILSGQIATLYANSTESVRWFQNITDTSSFNIGPSYTTPIMFNTTTYYVAAITAGGGFGNFALTANITQSGGGTGSYGPQNYNDGILPAYGNLPWGWVTTNGWIEFDWNNPVMFNKVIFYKDNRPTTGCTFQYWNGVAWNNFYSYIGTAITDSVTFPTVTSTRLRFYNIAGSSPNFREIQVFSNAGGGCQSPRVPVTVNVTLSNKDAKMVSIVSPSESCGLGTEQVKVKIKNYGATNISGGLTATYKVNNANPVTENVTNTIASLDTITYTFSTPINMYIPNLGGDSIFNFKAWVTLQNDTIHVNDTVSNYSITSKFKPLVPVGVNDTTVYGHPANLTASSAGGTIYWYASQTSPTLLGQGNTFTIPYLTNTTTYWASAAAGSESYVGPADNTIGTTSTNTSTYWLTNFNVLNPLGITIKSVDIFPAGMPGTAYTIALFNSSGSIQASYAGITTVSPGLKETVPINFNVPIGNSYKLGFTYLLNPGMYRNTSGASFPYTIPGMLTITGTNYSTNNQYYFYFYNWKVGNFNGCESDRTPVKACLRIIPIEAALMSFVSPIGGCTNNSEQVKVKVRNNGTSAITSGCNITYRINNGIPITQPLTGTLASNDSITFTFTTPFNPGVNNTNIDSIIHITAYITLAGDTIHLNDTIQNNFTFYYIPPSPTISGTTIPYATSATLHAISNDTIYWYNTPTGGTNTGMGSYFTSPILYNTTTYYGEAVSYNLSSSATVGTGTTPSIYPFTTSRQDGRTQMIFTASEILSAGGSVGLMNAFSFYFSTNSPAFINNLNIGIKNTSSVSLYSFDLTGFTSVYSGSYTVPDIGWQTINFQHPFYWDGVSNILVNLCFDNSSSSVNSAIYSSQVAGKTWQQAADSTAGCSLNLGATQNYRPNIKFNFGLPGCSSPRIPVVVNVATPPSCDVGVTQIVDPSSSATLSSNEQVTVTLKNYGTTAQTGIPLKYRVDNNPAISETYTGTIAAGASANYTFITTADLSAYQTFHLLAFTALGCDNILSNDTASKIADHPNYCVSAATSTLYADIGNVTISNINNGTFSAMLGNANANKTYSDFTTSLPPVFLAKGSIVPFSTSIIFNASNASNVWVKAFVDFNMDGVFDTTGTERIYNGQFTLNNPLNANVSIPAGALVGYTRMRVVARQDGNQTNTQPCGTYAYGETEDYAVMIYNPIPKDAGIIGFAQPFDSIYNEGDMLPVIAKLHNFGTTNLTSVQVTASFNSTSLGSVIWNGNLAPGADAEVNFPSITCLPGYNNNLCAYTTLSGDNNTFNDNNCKSFKGRPARDVGATALVNPTFTSCFGPIEIVKVRIKNYGIKTLLFNQNPVSVYANMQGANPALLGPLVISTDSLAVGAEMTVTVTNTANMSTAGSYIFNCYTVMANDGDASNDHFISSVLTAVGTTILPDTINFTGYTGDNLSTVFPHWSEGAGINTPSGAASAWTNQSGIGSTTNVTARVNLFGTGRNEWLVGPKFFATNRTMLDFDAAVTETGDINLADTMGTDDSVKVLISTDCGTSWNNIFALTRSTGLTKNLQHFSVSLSAYSGQLLKLAIKAQDGPVGDVNNYDFHLDNIKLWNQIFDAAVTQIVFNPSTDTVWMGVQAVAKIKIHNYGNSNISNFPVTYWLINSGVPTTPVVENFTGSIAPGLEANYNFTSTFAPTQQVFNLCARTILPLDVDTANDKTCKSIIAYLVGIDEVNPYGFNLGQNIPNPAFDNTFINYFLPTASKVKFSINNIFGQQIYTEEINAQSGANQITVNIQNFASGIYYYSLNYKGKRLTKKMVINK